MRRQAGAFELLTDGLGQRLFAAILLQQAPELPKPVDVGQGAVAIARRQIMTDHETVQLVFLVCREKLARQAHRTQHVGPEGLPQALEFTLDEAIVEAGMAGNQQTPMQAIGQFCRDLSEGRRVDYRLVADTVDLLDELRDRSLWVDQGAPGRDPVTLCFEHIDPRDAVP